MGATNREHKSYALTYLFYELDNKHFCDDLFVFNSLYGDIDLG